MAINYEQLPVYEQKERILQALNENQVIVVQSPTGSGKTTQLPVILHEAGYSQNGIIAVTQPRRIAAMSVSEYIAKQLHTDFPGLVGYKMRFEDKTDFSTKIKIMTDGILLQEMKLDPWLSKYSVVMVDEAHERSLNIDFVLGLLKRVLTERKDFKVIVSSATMNAEAFSTYFDGCPIVTIDTQVFPVAMIYDPPAVAASSLTDTATEALLNKIESTISRVIDNHEQGDILVFLPGEKIIKDCMIKLYSSHFKNKIHIVPLYGRLSKEEQEKVFDSAPLGKKKVVLSTNIAETSVTINGISTVIDSGLAKLNFYNPHTFTSSLIETPVSKASCNQRRGRAGRTREGVCYRLYSRKDFETRSAYTTEEIYRTDLSEVILRMSELGITDFDKFNFISPPNHEDIVGAVETLNLLKALNEDGTLSRIGRLMVEFPLEPRISRIIVESILKYPDVLDEVLIAAAFLSAQTPFILPPGEEMDARKAHHAFRDMQGDFVSYVKMFRTYLSMTNKERFCTNNYLDYRVMTEIENIKVQLEEIISKIGLPLTGGGSMDNYLCCISSGMIQFVCIREGKETYSSLTADHITIHPGSSVFRNNPLYIVAGEIVKTSRTFAMSVSPLTKSIIQKIDPALEGQLVKIRGKNSRSLTGSFEYRGSNFRDEKQKVGRSDSRFAKNKFIGDEGLLTKNRKKEEDSIIFGGMTFMLEKVKGKKTAVLPWSSFKSAVKIEQNENLIAQISGLRGRITFPSGYRLFDSEKMEIIIKAANALNLEPIPEKKFNRHFNCNVMEKGGLKLLINNLDSVMKVTVAKSASKEMGFICLFTDGNGNYWFKVSRGFPTALNESLSSLEKLIDDCNEELDNASKEKVNIIYRVLNSLYD